MDESVLKAIAKWPNVPAVYGWLSLDRRGQWQIKDDRITNALVTGFIGRNYSADLQGRWFFQNGPQRVYVRLDYTPYVFFVERADGEFVLLTHTGVRANQIREALVDENGAVVLRTDIGVGAVCDRDLPVLADALVTSAGRPVDESDMADFLRGIGTPLFLATGIRRVLLTTGASSELPKRFAYVADPKPAPGEADC